MYKIQLIHVLDGLLHHETDLNIEEHYTDTVGYTDQIFGLTHLLGFKFAPRIRDLSDSKLFTIDKASEYPKLDFFRKQGELRERTLQYQLQIASALNIIINHVHNYLWIYRMVIFRKYIVRLVKK